MLMLTVFLVGLASAAENEQSEIQRTLKFGFKKEVLWTIRRGVGPTPTMTEGRVTIKNARMKQNQNCEWFEKHGFKCQTLRDDPVVKEAMRLLMIYQGFDSMFALGDIPRIVELVGISPRKNLRTMNLQLFARVWERPEAMKVISYMLGLKGQAVDMLSANFRTSKFSKKAEHNPALQILNIPIPKVHDDSGCSNNSPRVKSYLPAR